MGTRNSASFTVPPETGALGKFYGKRSNWYSAEFSKCLAHGGVLSRLGSLPSLHHSVMI